MPRLGQRVAEALVPWYDQAFVRSVEYTESGVISWLFTRLGRGAVTWNKRVHFAVNRYDAESVSILALIAHELLHVQQQQEMGWLHFLAGYLWHWPGSQGGRSHPLEAPAYARQDEVNAALSTP